MDRIFKYFYYPWGNEGNGIIPFKYLFCQKWFNCSKLSLTSQEHARIEITAWMILSFARYTYLFMFISRRLLRAFNKTQLLMRTNGGGRKLSLAFSLCISPLKEWALSLVRFKRKVNSMIRRQWSANRDTLQFLIGTSKLLPIRKWRSFLPLY